jgi:hypothetical protein
MNAAEEITRRAQEVSRRREEQQTLKYAERLEAHYRDRQGFYERKGTPQAGFDEAI